MTRRDAAHGYVIRGGNQGKERLDVLARVLRPTSTQLLERVGLAMGMKCLDVGCGGGHVTILMAAIVGPEGRVIGTDTDPEILALAEEDAKAAAATNVELQQQDACARAWHNEFDVAYARFLLSHVNPPEKCLTAMMEACLPGGTIVIEDTDFAGSFCCPPCAAYDRYKQVQINVIQPVHINGEGKLMAPLTMSRISEALITEALATDDEVQEILTDLNQLAADSETLISLPRIFQVWGKRD